MDHLLNNNTTSNVTIVGTNVHHRQMSIMFKVAVSLLYTAAIITGSVGNILVILVVTWRRQVTSSTSKAATSFILSISVADLLVCLVCMPMFFVYQTVYWPDWPYGIAMCKFIAYSIHSSVYASALSLLAIAWDRYYAFVHPLRPNRVREHYIAIIFAIWFVSLSTLSPSLVVHEVGEVHSGKKVVLRCIEVWERKSSRNAYLIYRVALYVFFSIQVSYLYLAVSKVLWTRVAPGDGATSTTNAMKAKKKTVKMLMIVVLLFIFCWAPYVLEKSFIFFDKEAPAVLIIMGNFLGMLNSCTNPIVYNISSGSFRQGIRSVLKCRYGKRARREVMRRQFSTNKSTNSVNRDGGTNTNFLNFTWKRNKISPKRKKDGGRRKNTVSEMFSNTATLF